MASQGLCAYTRKKLDWSLIGTYDNLEARSSGAEYMRKFSRMPTVDHNGNEKDGIPKFQICSLAVNDAKSHMSEQNFIQLCRDVLGWRGKNKK